MPTRELNRSVTVTAMVDSFHLRLVESLPEKFPRAFHAPVGSFAHLVALAHTHRHVNLDETDSHWDQEKLQIQTLLRYTNPTP